MSTIRRTNVACRWCALALCAGVIAAASGASAQTARASVERTSGDATARGVLAAGATMWATSYASSIVFSIFIGPRFDAIPLAGSFVSGSTMLSGCMGSASNQCELHLPFGLVRVGLGVAQVVGASMTVFSLVALASMPPRANPRLGVNPTAARWTVLPFVSTSGASLAAGGLVAAGAF